MIPYTLATIARFVFVDPTNAYITALFMIGGAILLYLMVKADGEFSTEDTEENADEFAGVIKESQGPVNMWLWASYVAMIIWAVAYLILHGAEFALFP